MQKQLQIDAQPTRETIAKGGTVQKMFADDPSILLALRTLRYPNGAICSFMNLGGQILVVYISEFLGNIFK